ncbi:acetyl-CoA carboxylase biotin carboxyl carrier protein [Eggerthellaceae bacterium zg-1084]|uniref:Acetyl-CoA carboxylase biotin carboxyl carrier protein n=1 Tax=Berryella wangjianweii TaxID=2734634 RepID=A0A6M8J4X8_9ACTN|nr:acetyl-CoA carboxylase biotin carboxyl carrier protein [Berryella wangjianweii]NPD30844.1 acetyl-CoA carboxylase biotin carboxyl carrier protein [Berryella wangjianweii]NPD31711.1 acetyl-CoA carboxylase biotin carboxyl carrier protein [Eggerthellaceae bacterium zg-997]QKF07683.1 acetyl-CoA carboxylase biotin carboxyl carrier protein [Berryella wangjianweii]
MPKLHIMDVTIRDGQQSLWATRMHIGDMLPILPAMDKVGYWAIEAWGGATFDTCLRFLDENPWERLRSIKAQAPNTPLAMLSRGQNLVGYKHYSKDVVHRFIAAAKRNGVHVFRVFDALNDIRNVVDNAEAIKECGGHFEGAISYTVSPVHTLDSYLEYGQMLKDLGADTIAIKDMAGLLTPYRTERIVRAFNAEIGLPVHVHCHYVGGMAPANILKAAEAGATIADTAHAPLAFGNSHPAVEMVAAALQESAFDTGLDLELLFEIANYWEEVRKRGRFHRGVSSLTHMQVYSHQVPGGMMSNLMAQLAVQNAEDRLPEVMAEIPKVRAEVGYPPLVTPMSQIVGTQAVFNVLTGRRWGVVSREMKDYLCGYYGKAPGRIDKDVLDKVVGTDDVLDPGVAPGSLVTTTFDQIAEEIGDLAQSEEDVLMYALFPIEARTYLSKHRTQEKVEFLLAEESSATKEDDYVDINQIRELVRIAEESGVGEIVVEEEGVRVAVRMPGAAPAQAVAATSSAPAAAAAPASESATASASPAEAARPASWRAVTAPMVGTFYEAPAPGEPPFVKVGDEVSAGQTLCIVEAMKLMNEIAADEMGTVREVCLEDGAAVEFGTVLFYVEPLGKPAPAPETD